MTKSYYDVLGVPESASIDEIRTAYRKEAWTHHPDRGGNPEEMKEINAAYEVLSDGDARANYDEQLGITAHDTPSLDAPTRPTFGNGPPVPWGNVPRRPAPPLESNASFLEIVMGAAFLAIMVFNYWIIERVTTDYFRTTLPVLVGVFSAAGATVLEGYALTVIAIAAMSRFTRSK